MFNLLDSSNLQLQRHFSRGPELGKGREQELKPPQLYLSEDQILYAVAVEGEGIIHLVGFTDLTAVVWI